MGVRDVALSIRGLGYFAEVIHDKKKFLVSFFETNCFRKATNILYPDEGLLKLLKDITSRSENIFLK